MTIFSRFLATMKALGLTSIKSSLDLLRRGKHVGAKTSKLAGRRSRVRLRIARGAGSISAKADITKLAEAGWYADARLMAEEHERRCKEVLFPAAWWRKADSETLT